LSRRAAGSVGDERTSVSIKGVEDGIGLVAPVIDAKRPRMNV